MHRQVGWVTPAEIDAFVLLAKGEPMTYGNILKSVDVIVKLADEIRKSYLEGTLVGEFK